jgi:hypothetical protein
MNMKKFGILVFLVFLVMICGVGNALLIQENLSSVTLGSDVIIYGKIVDVKSQWNTQNTQIETIAQVQTSDVLKNTNGSNVSSGSTIQVIVPGGTVGNQTEWTEDTPVLLNDTVAFMFLEESNNGSYTLYSLSQGYYPTTNGQLFSSKPVKGSASADDINAFKTQVITILQDSGTSAGITDSTPSSTTSPSKTTTTTQQASIVFAPMIALIAIVISIMWKK